MNWWGPVIVFAIPVSFSILVLLGVAICNRILWNRMKARHRREWESIRRETEAMFKAWENAGKDWP